MNFVLAIPLGARLAVLFLLGTLVGAAVNWAAYALAWNRRAISPWSAPHAAGPRRRLSDRVPLAGWFGLRREASLFGRGFWIRPLAVEVLTGLLFAGLYAIELERFERPWFNGLAALPPLNFLTTNLPLPMHLQYASHMTLIAFMLAASLVDLDEKTIPDTITVPGTLVALALSSIYPWSLPAAADWLIGNDRAVEFLTLASPEVWPNPLDGRPLGGGIVLALFCWTLWCGGLMPRVWKTRHGLRTAVRVFFHRLRVERITYSMLALWAVGAVAIALAALAAPQEHWAGMLTSLVGMAAGGGIIWSVRTIGSAVLHKEAMGFGDVTLMSMIGAFVGWQACLIVFFLAPFFGLALAIANWVIHREHEIPYGPFLCLAALAVVLKWPTLWERSVDAFALGWVIPAMIACCLVLLGVLLWFYTLAVGLFAPRE